MSRSVKFKLDFSGVITVYGICIPTHANDDDATTSPGRIINLFVCDDCGFIPARYVPARLGRAGEVLMDEIELVRFMSVKELRKMSFCFWRFN